MSFVRGQSRILYWVKNREIERIATIIKETDSFQIMGPRFQDKVELCNHAQAQDLSLATLTSQYCQSFVNN